METQTPPKVDFKNTEIAFSRMSDKALKKAAWLFGLMNKGWLVNIFSRLGLLAFKLRLPIGPFVKHTIFAQFCGGTTLEESQPTVEKLWSQRVLTILDYGAEAKDTNAAFDATMKEIQQAISFAHANESVAVVSCKITGLGPFSLLEKNQTDQPLNAKEKEAFLQLTKRLDNICKTAHQYKVGVFIDAEESWIQDTIDDLANAMMERYNKESVIVYNTYQLYRHDKLAYLKASFEEAKEKGYLLGAKLVRGAYMDKERERAEAKGYISPIQKSKADTDRDFDEAIAFCVDHYEQIGFCNATHNELSCRKMLEMIAVRNMDNNHPHLNFCQLYGMSDHLSFNLAKAGFCVAKYVPYGPVRDVVPYLIRRAKENSAVTGDMSRELQFIKKEIARRKKA